MLTDHDHQVNMIIDTLLDVKYVWAHIKPAKNTGRVCHHIAIQDERTICGIDLIKAKGDVTYSDIMDHEDAYCIEDCKRCITVSKKYPTRYYPSKLAKKMDDKPDES